MNYGEGKFTVINSRGNQDYTLTIRYEESDDGREITLYIVYKELADILDTLRIPTLRSINFQIIIKETTNQGNVSEIPRVLPEEIMNMTSAELRRL